MGLVAAMRRGSLSELGVELSFTETVGSTRQLQDLLAGEFDVCSTALDNVLVRIDRAEDLVPLFVGSLGTSQKLVGRAGVTSIAGLGGRRLGVDAAASGYALLLYELLARRGLEREAYDAIEIGGTRQRLDALRAGRIDAALLGWAFAAQALREGCTMIATACADFPSYPGLEIMARRRWAAANRELVVRFLIGLARGIRWASAPAHQAAVLAMLTEQYGGDADLAGAAYQDEIGSTARFLPSVDEYDAAIRGVVDLRRRAFGGTAIADIAHVFDPSYVSAALAQA